MEEIISFLEQLCMNNNREWFNDHKDTYLRLQKQFNQFAEQLITAMEQIDPALSGLTLKDCTYRIYRDLRFSLDKKPYKTHFGCYLCPGGKKSGNAGYYFHVEAPDSDYIGCNLLAAGIHAPDAEMLKKIREAVYFEGIEFEKALAKSKSFTLEKDGGLVRVPNGYEKDSQFAEYLKLKDFSISHIMQNNILYSDHLLEYVTEKFKEAREYNAFLNRAISY